MTSYDLLYQMSELSKENDISFRVRHGVLFVEWIDFDNYSEPLSYKQAFSLIEVENVYKSLNAVVDEFLSRLDAELEKLNERSDIK